MAEGWRLINGVNARWERRDISQASARELQVITDLIEVEKDHEGPGRDLVEFVVESDYVDKDIVRFRTSVRSTVVLEDVYEE